MWFICSLIGIFTLVSLTYNPFVISFILALIISILATKDME